MAYTKPTLSELITQIGADLFSRFPDLDPALENSMAQNIAEVIAGAINGTYGNLDYNLDQQFPDTASDDNATRWASIFGLTRLAATKADGDVVFTGEIGSSVLTGASLSSSDGTIYTVDTGFTLAAASESHQVTAETAGTSGNLDAGATLTFVSVPSGMGSTATVDSGAITGGTDQETDAELRVRILTKLANPPKGGAAHDYEAWAKEATDATRVWVRTPDNPGTDTVAAGQVKLYFAMDNTYTSDDDGTDVVTNGGFATDSDWTKGTGWTIGSGVATHAAGTGSDISQTIAVLDQGSAYLLTYTVSGRTAGTLTPKVGSGGSGTAVSADGTYIEMIACATDDDLIFTADASFDGSIDNVSLIYSGVGNAGLPLSGDVTDVQDYIDARRPVMEADGFTAISPAAYPINFDITISPDNATNQANTEAELALQIKKTGVVGGTIPQSDIYEAMSRVANLTSWTVNSNSTLTAGAGELHTMGAVTFS